ncbi:MAG: hypothetical protein NVS3B2_01880 [Ramlibacter sp.]
MTIPQTGREAAAPDGELEAQGKLQRRWSDGAQGATPSADASGAWSMEQHWPTLVATLSEQAVDSSNLVLRALDFMVGAGRMRRAEAKALSDALYRMRDASLRAQQITRLASGRIRQTRDRVELAELIRDQLDSRREEFEAANAIVQSSLSPVDVLLDPPVAVSLVNNVVDWGLSFSKQLTLTLETPVWPAPARLLVRVATPPRATPPGQPAGAWGTKERGRRLNDGLHWMLLRQMAASANLTVTRSGSEGAAMLTIEFPKTFLSAGGVSSVELFAEDSPGASSLLNAWVLVIAGDDRLRTTATDTLRHAGIGVKSVSSLAEARKLVAAGKPNALVIATAVTGSAGFSAFKAELTGEHGSCPVVEITERPPSFHQSGFQGYEVAKVGRDQMKKELGPAVLFELAKAVI